MDEQQRMERERQGLCRGLNVNCRKFRTGECDWKGERNRGPEDCPKCGESRLCQRTRVPGYEFCRTHGGANIAAGFYGSGSPPRGGGSSKWPIANLAAKYFQIIENPVVISVRSAMEALNVRMYQLFERLNTGESPERMERLLLLWEGFSGRMPKQYLDMLTGDQKKAYMLLDQEFEKAYHDYAAWDQMLKLFDMQRKMTETEMKVIKEMRAMMTAEQGYELTAKLAAIVMEVVQDDGELREIVARFARLIGDDIVVENERRSTVEAEFRSSQLDNGELLDTGG